LDELYFETIVLQRYFEFANVTECGEAFLSQTRRHFSV